MRAKKIESDGAAIEPMTEQEIEQATEQLAEAERQALRAKIAQTVRKDN